jgi:hypothetical protein
MSTLLQRDSSSHRRGARRHTVRLMALLLAACSAACATGPFSLGRRATPAEAIARCIESTPAEQVMFADAFSACMEKQGWVHASNAR